MATLYYDGIVTAGTKYRPNYAGQHASPAWADDIVLFSALAFDVDPPPDIGTATSGGGTNKRDKKLKRTIRFSDLGYRERLEALKDLPVKPFSELEQAAVQLAAADEDEQGDDEAVLLAIMKVLIH